MHADDFRTRAIPAIPGQRQPLHGENWEPEGAAAPDIPRPRPTQHTEMSTTHDTAPTAHPGRSSSPDLPALLGHVTAVASILWRDADHIEFQGPMGGKAPRTPDIRGLAYAPYDEDPSRTAWSPFLPAQPRRPEEKGREDRLEELAEWLDVLVARHRDYSGLEESTDEFGNAWFTLRLDVPEGV